LQGEIIDSIEANVESSSIRVGEGVEQLRQAERYQVRNITDIIKIISRITYRYQIFWYR
jgi:SNARE domain